MTASSGVGEFQRLSRPRAAGRRARAGQDRIRPSSRAAGPISVAPLGSFRLGCTGGSSRVGSGDIATPRSALARRMWHGFGPASSKSGSPAYGHEGPWANRRGFDSLVRTASGFNAAEAEASGVRKPKPLPAQALDHATG